MRFKFVAAAWLLALMSGCLDFQSKVADSSFVPADFQVPIELRADEFVLSKLLLADAQADYEAVMESKVRLRELFAGDWPADDFSLQENEKDIVEHVGAFEQRRAFTYSIKSPDSLTVLGCVYIYPDENDVPTILFWVRDQHQELEPKVAKVLKEWLKNHWPFESFAVKTKLT